MHALKTCGQRWTFTSHYFQITAIDILVVINDFDASPQPALLATHNDLPVLAEQLLFRYRL